MLSVIASLVFLASLAAFGIAILKQLAPSLTALEQWAYGTILGNVVGSILLLGLAVPIGLPAGVMVVTIFSALGALVYWPGRAIPTVSGWRAGWVRALSAARAKLGVWPAIVIVIFIARFALLWSGALTLEDDGLWAGHLYLWSDWTVHLGDTTAFAYADNFPPEHPRLAGAPLAYHYLISLTAAGMVVLGMDPIAALPLQSFLLSAVLVAALFAFGLRIAGDRAIAALALALFLLGGSLGWVLLFDPAAGGPLQALTTHPWDRDAQQAANFRWLNPYFALIMPQRAALYGLPLVLLVLTLLLLAVRERRMLLFATAGVVAGFLPIGHLGSFAALGLIAPIAAVLFPQRGWIVFFGLWLVIGGAFLYGVQGGDVAGGSGLRWEPGWLTANDPWPWFWVKNFGLFIVFGVLGLVVRDVMPRDSRLMVAFLPAFIVPNLFILSVFAWDNSKVLMYPFLALAILSAAVLVRLWRVQRDLLSRGLVAIAVATMIGSGVLTNLNQLMGLDRTRLAGPSDLALADAVREQTPSDAVFAVGLEHNDPVPMLTGRQVVTSYTPWLRSLGLDPSQQEADLRAIYRLDPEAESLIAQYGVDYVVVGSWEEAELEADVDGFSRRYPLAMTVGEYRVFSVSGRAEAQ